MAEPLQPKPKKPAADNQTKARWDVTIGDYRAASGDEAGDFDRRFEALGEILARKLWQAGGYKSELAFLKAEAPDLDPRTAHSHCRVAKYFDRDDIQRFGPTKLDLLLDYFIAHGGLPETPAKFKLDKQVIVLPRRGRDQRIPFADATAVQLKLAKRAAPTRSTSKPATRKSSPVVLAVEDALRKEKLRGIAVSLRGGALAFTGVAPADLARFAKAVGKVKPAKA